MFQLSCFRKARFAKVLLERLFEEVRDREGEEACCGLSFRFSGFFSLLGLGPPEDRGSVTALFLTWFTLFSYCLTCSNLN